MHTNLIVKQVGQSHSVYIRMHIQATHQNEGTWILTCGTNCGVAKLVGDAVHKNSQAVKMDGSSVMPSVNCIGIAPWGYVAHKEDRSVYEAIKNVGL